jgi:hypothetical protein
VRAGFTGSGVDAGFAAWRRLAGVLPATRLTDGALLILMVDVAGEIELVGCKADFLASVGVPEDEPPVATTGAAGEATGFQNDSGNGTTMSSSSNSKGS